MKTLSEMSTGHLIIEAIILFVVIIAAFYILYSFFCISNWFNQTKTGRIESELHARDRYAATERLMNEINAGKCNHSRTYIKVRFGHSLIKCCDCRKIISI
jgi:uncharacterized protein HemY